MSLLPESDVKDMVRSVLERYPVHLSARSISLTIERQTGEEVSIRKIVNVLHDIPVDVIDKNRRKYKIIQ